METFYNGTYRIGGSLFDIFIPYFGLVSHVLSFDESVPLLKMLDVMVEIGHQAHDITYNTLIGGFCKVNNLEKDMELLQEMLEKDCNIDLVHYSTLIYGLCKHHRKDKY